MSGASLSKLAGQVLIAGFPGADLPVELRKVAARGELSGFILFKRNLASVDDTRELNARLRAACPSETPPWVAIDQEGGRVQRLGAPVLQLPPMRVLGAIDDLGLTETAAELLGRQLVALGFTLDFAPVLDVDSNPANTVIGDRSFGREPERCARHGLAFARGLTRAGIANCGKHFPGHGDTTLDTHFALPHLPHALERLDRVELVPFRAARDALDAVMTAHIVYDALDPERPVTLSERALTHLLRERVGFSGLLVSDDLEMKAIADHYGVAEAACAAVAAGCDALLVCSKPELCLEAHAALVERAEREPAFAARLESAGARSLEVRRQIARAAPRFDARALEGEARALEQRIAEAQAKAAGPATSA